MKTFKLFSIAALALLMASCSEELNQIDQPVKSEGIPFSATISIGNTASTRVLNESGGNLVATWSIGEKVALIHNGVSDELSVSAVNAGVATISGTITGSPSTGDAVTIIYPATAADDATGNVKADLLKSQDGTLNTIAQKYDVRKGSGTLKVSGTASLNGNVSLTNQYAIWKLTLQDSGGSALSAKALAIKDGSDNLLATATLSSAGNEFYVAVPATTSVKLVAVNGPNTYAYSKNGISISASNYYRSTVKLTQEEYTDLSATATANTYIVSAAGKYKFKATVKGNGGIDPLTGATATAISGIAGVKVLWELGDTYGKAIKYTNPNYDISYLDGYVYFSTPATFQSGDAYVAVYDSSDNILWSWLIWATEVPSETTYDGLTIMDRNLAAIGTGNVQCRGLMYEWGRKDPFPSPNSGSYTPNTYVPARMTAFTISDFDAAGMTVAYSIAHPTTYPKGWSQRYWQTESEYTLNMWWNGAKTIYDPCPPGWKVPSKDEMQKVISSGVNLPGNGFIGNVGSDFGYGNPGSVYYWTSTGSSRDRAWGYHGGFTNDHVDDANRSGWSIRPVKE